MVKQSTITLTALPQESLRPLEKSVARQSGWRILTAGEDDQPRFVIEKPVGYTISRGWRMHSTYRITGSLQKTKSGDTALQYAVSGQAGVPIFQAALTIGVLLVMTILLGALAFSPGIRGNWVGIALLGVMIVTILLYGLFAYRNYQGHLKELNRFMEEFAEKIPRA